MTALFVLFAGSVMSQRTYLPDGRPQGRPRNLYVHFPFCRRKCTYCALHSKAGTDRAERDFYVAQIAREIERLETDGFDTVYFGGGSPALCNLVPVLRAVRPLLGKNAEFTVELNPLDLSDGGRVDVSDGGRLLDVLEDGGVNRISMGMQSLDSETLADMGRGYDPEFAESAFALVKSRFSNAGIDLIAGYPRTGAKGGQRAAPRLPNGWGLAHCSVYSLMVEEGTALWCQAQSGRKIPDDDEALDEIKRIAAHLKAQGLERYEISNYAVPGKECRHNMAVWRGEDYFGLGEGARGRIGRARTEDAGTPSARSVEVSPEEDALERTIFMLRTREGLNPAARPGWEETLAGYAAEGLLVRVPDGRYRLTERGTEVCDTILAALV